ncbi:MAG: 4-hydroxy-tetrahydrodipicolinate reductase [Oscillospiraceae bacterium]|nr:4-hydroxy-tetrahydrodipicolinate reductase [Oscillospiraceae bacterium]
MVEIVISGACGKMGRTLAACIAERDGCKVIAGIDLFPCDTLGFPVVQTPAALPQTPDVIIDYSNPAGLEGLLQYALSVGVPLVLATTGYSEEQMGQIRQAAQQIPIFFSFNMSIGIQLLMALSKKAAAVLGNQFDIEIIEKHHNQKIDAPSGTALMLLNAICEETDPPKHPVYDRHSVRKKRESAEIGMHSIRGGTIVGEHEVLFAGPDECISLKHTASSKRVFAEGSVNAAIFMAKGRKAGLYDMTHLLEEV